MIIGYPNDDRGLLYQVIDLNGQTVHAYRDIDGALASMEGDQRRAIWSNDGFWVTEPPAPAALSDQIAKLKDRAQNRFEGAAVDRVAKIAARP